MSCIDTHPTAAFDRRAPVVRSTGARRGARWAPAAMTELAIAAGVYAVYWFGRSLTQDAGSAAGRNARRVIDVERSLGVFSEIDVQRWAMEIPGAIAFLNRYYVAVHFPATIAFLLWVFVRRRAAYAMIRTWFAVVTLAGLAIHVVFPLAPPRMTPGFVDTLDVFGPDIYSNDTSASVANQFAAMPSLHFGWALLAAIGLRHLTERRRNWWFAHPVVTLLAIVATGNHYWIDAAIAGLLVLAAAGGTQARAARGPRRPVPRPAHAGDGRSAEHRGRHRPPARPDEREPDVTALGGTGPGRREVAQPRRSASISSALFIDERPGMSRSLASSWSSFTVISSSGLVAGSPCSRRSSSSRTSSSASTASEKRRFTSAS
jgi:hypothetical protein